MANRILVQGVSASGKTTFAKKLATKLGLPLIMADEIIWQPGWVHGDNAEIAKVLFEKSGQDRWIIEGYVNNEAIEGMVEVADLILYLDYSSLVSSWHYVERYFLHRKKPRKELPGSPEHFKITSLLRIIRKEQVNKLEQILKEGNYEEKIVRFKTPKEADEYLEKYRK